MKQRSLALLCPNALQVHQELLHAAFTNIGQLDVINQNLMMEIQKKAGSRDMWSNTDHLENLSNQRQKV